MLGKDNYENIRFINDYPFNVTTSGLSPTFPSHWHNYAELIIVLQDILEFDINDMHYLLHKKDLLLVHPGELHALTYNNEFLSSYIIIQFDASFIFSLPDFQKHQYWIQNFHYLPYLENSSLSNHIINIASDIIHLYYNDILYKDAKICSNLMQMFVLIGEYVISDNYVLRTSNPSNLDSSDHIQKNINHSEFTQKMIDVCSYIAKNCTYDINLTTAANYAGFSKYHFSRLFSEFTGSSFVEFLTNERLKKAMDLLLNTDLTILDVAMTSGFFSISTFNRSFQKHKNATPSNFRKKYTNMKSLE